MDREEIKGILPHRDPMLLVDRMEVDENGVGHAWYTIPEDPFYCRGHFPGNPIVPGVILLEIMAQGTTQLYKEAFKDNLVVYRGLEGVKFKGVVKPGDTCETTCTLKEHMGRLYVCDAVLSVAGKRCAQAQITVAEAPKA